MIYLYCPKCGELNEVKSECSPTKDILAAVVYGDYIIAPGNSEAVCPNCGVHWQVEVQFYEDE